MCISKTRPLLLIANKLTHFDCIRHRTRVVPFNFITSYISITQSNLRPFSTQQKTKMSNSDTERMDYLVHVQRVQKQDTISISFMYMNRSHPKRINLHRRINDPLSSTLERIKLTISRPHTTKAERKKARLEGSEITKSPQPCQVSLSLNGSTMDPDSTTNSDAWIDGAVLNLNGNLYRIAMNTPNVRTLKLPSRMFVGFFLMPLVYLENCEIQDCKFVWHRRISREERDQLSLGESFDETSIELVDNTYLYKLTTNFIYCPSQDDVAHQLKITCIPSNGQQDGMSLSVFSTSLVEDVVVKFPFEKRHQLTTETTSHHDDFRIVTYNILADYYADTVKAKTELFRHCPAKNLHFDYRRPLLLKEIAGYNADIICLQEVDRKEFLICFGPFFKNNNDFSATYNSKGTNFPEGVATFFRNSKFELIQSHKTIIKDLIDPLYSNDFEGDKSQKVEDFGDKNDALSAVADDEVEPHFILKDLTSDEAKKCLSKFDEMRKIILASKQLRERIFSRQTILQVTLLKTKGSENRFILVANTHLYSAADADHIRLLQGAICLKYIEFLKEFYLDMLTTQSYCDPKLSIVFCGDMNSCPENGLFKLLTQGAIGPDLPDWSSGLEGQSVKSLSLNTSLRFSSAYQNIKYTNYTLDFVGCLDYIYYDCDSLKCESVIPLPDHEDVTAVGAAIPSETFPSDHIALIANLKHLR